MTKKLNEDTMTEQPVIEWLKETGYDYKFDPDLPSDEKMVAKLQNQR